MYVRREKWLSLFAGVTAIIFCVASSDYDLVLEEDGVTNRMHDSLELFKQVSSRYRTGASRSALTDKTQIAMHHALRTIPIILFLNKKDILEKKIKEVDLNTCFSDYKGNLT